MTRLPELFSRNDRALDEAREHEQKVTELYAEIGRLTTQVNWLKKNLVCNLSRAERLALVERDAPGAPAELPLRVQAELLSLSRSSLYYQPALPPAQEVFIKHRIDELYTAWPFYGSRCITAQLVKEGTTISHHHIASHKLTSNVFYDNYLSPLHN